MDLNAKQLSLQLAVALLLAGCLQEPAPGSLAGEAAQGRMFQLAEAAPAGAQVQGNATGECSTCGPLDDPTIYPGEIVATSAEWDDGGGDPPFPWYAPPQEKAVVRG